MWFYRRMGVTLDHTVFQRLRLANPWIDDTTVTTPCAQERQLLESALRKNFNTPITPAAKVFGGLRARDDDYRTTSAAVILSVLGDKWNLGFAPLSSLLTTLAVPRAATI